MNKYKRSIIAIVMMILTPIVIYFSDQYNNGLADKKDYHYGWSVEGPGTPSCDCYTFHWSQFIILVLWIVILVLMSSWISRRK